MSVRSVKNLFYLWQIGKSLFDQEGSKIVQKVMDKAKEKNVQIHLPVDVVTGSKFAEDATVGAATVETGITGDAMVSCLSLHSIYILQFIGLLFYYVWFITNIVAANVLNIAYQSDCVKCLCGIVLLASLYSVHF